MNKEVENINSNFFKYFSPFLISCLYRKYILISKVIFSLIVISLIPIFNRKSCLNKYLENIKIITLVKYLKIKIFQFIQIIKI